jgi:H+/Cl- antiporter ClcA
MQKMFLGEGKTWYASAYMFYVTFSMMCGMLAGTMTIYWAKKSMGSGIPELMAILQGVSIPDFFSYKVLVAKSFGVVLAVAGTLCVGKEGPLAHIGACCAVLVLYLPLSALKQF